MQRTCALTLVGLAYWVPSVSQAQALDVAMGGKLFATHCVECHSTKEGRHKKGPSLFNMVGTKAGLNADYKYSDALKNSHLTWDLATLSKYLEAPKAFVPGGKMKYDGMRSASDRAQVINYLAAQRPQ